VSESVGGIIEMVTVCNGICGGKGQQEKTNIWCAAGKLNGVDNQLDERQKAHEERGEGAWLPGKHENNFRFWLGFEMPANPVKSRD